MVRKSRQVRKHNQLQERNHQPMVSGKPAPLPVGYGVFRILHGSRCRYTHDMCNPIKE